MITVAQNPLLEPFNTPYGTYPFSKIKTEHFLPAFKEAMRLHLEEIDSIVNNPEPATFANTIEAYEKSGHALSVVEGIFFNLTESNSEDEIQQIELEVSPLLSNHGNAIRLNEKLFARIRAVYQQRKKLKLSTEQQTLLKKIYDSFADNGANLSDSDKQKYRDLSVKLSDLSIRYGQNVLKETNSWQKHITDSTLLAGVPQNTLTLLREQAAAKGLEGWLLNLKPTTYVPILKYAENRELRHEIWYAYSTRCCHGGDFDNREIVKEIVNTRLEIAKLLGNENYAQYVLKKRMAGDSKGVYGLLDKLREAYYPVAKREYEELQEFAHDLDLEGQLQPWDWSFYSEKLKKQRYDISDEILRPYFELSKVKKGVFGLAEQLYGIRFEPAPDIEVYHPEVEAFRVMDEKRKFLAVLYTDFHPRDSKRGGAWMSEFKGQWKVGKKEDSRPHVVIVMNFTRPTADTPALLTLDEVTTFLHEFGHSLHGMLSRCHYETLSGTNVYRDFVELPSQFMENYAFEKQFIDQWAEHYQTGEKLSEELIKKIREASNYHAAYACDRQLSFGYLDMAWHTMTTPFDGDVIEFEKHAMLSTNVLPSDPTTCMSTTFNHIFSGGYAAGYYGYKWAEVLDADAFSVFQEKGLFNKSVAKKFRTRILEKGGSENPSVLYRDFRGQDFTIDAMLKRDGIKVPPKQAAKRPHGKVQAK